MSLRPLGKLPAGPESPFDALMRRAPAAANSDGKLALVRAVESDPVVFASERFALRGLFANSFMLVGVGGLIEVKPLSIDTHGRTFDEAFLAEFDEVAQRFGEISTLQIQIEQYKLIGLTAFLPFLQEQLETLQEQFHAIARGYGVPTVTGALNMVASAGGGQSTSVDGSLAEQEIRRRLKDPDMSVQWKAWKDLYALDPVAAKNIGVTDLGPPHPGIPGLNGTVTRAKPVFAIGTSNDMKSWYGTWRPELMLDSSWIPVEVDVASLHPSETLVDFVADRAGGVRQPVMLRYLEILKRIVARKGLISPDVVIKEFFETSWVSTRAVVPICVIQLPSGYRVIANGHHRVAALVQAVRENIIPAEWLKRIPVDMQIFPNDFPIPEVLYLQVRAPAYQMSVDDLLPSLTPTP